ncbi:unnamed protein product [Amoebophrya sp. A25]|nr:unnamed protein product [Amoebophrya sp. A25]|eukprot:GSA25T00006342001.1
MIGIGFSTNEDRVTGTRIHLHLDKKKMRGQQQQAVQNQLFPTSGRTRDHGDHMEDAHSEPPTSEEQFDMERSENENIFKEMTNKQKTSLMDEEDMDKKNEDHESFDDDILSKLHDVVSPGVRSSDVEATALEHHVATPTTLNHNVSHHEEESHDQLTQIRSEWADVEASLATQSAYFPHGWTPLQVYAAQGHRWWGDMTEEDNGNAVEGQQMLPDHDEENTSVLEDKQDELQEHLYHDDNQHHPFLIAVAMQQFEFVADYLQRPLCLRNFHLRHLWISILSGQRQSIKKFEKLIEDLYPELLFIFTWSNKEQEADARRTQEADQYRFVQFHQALKVASSSTSEDDESTRDDEINDHVGEHQHDETHIELQSRTLATPESRGSFWSKSLARGVSFLSRGRQKKMSVESSVEEQSGTTARSTAGLSTSVLPSKTSVKKGRTSASDDDEQELQRVLRAARVSKLELVAEYVILRGRILFQDVEEPARSKTSSRHCEVEQDVYVLATYERLVLLRAVPSSNFSSKEPPQLFHSYSLAKGQVRKITCVELAAGTAILLGAGHACEFSATRTSAERAPLQEQLQTFLVQVGAPVEKGSTRRTQGTLFQNLHRIFLQDARVSASKILDLKEMRWTSEDQYEILVKTCPQIKLFSEVFFESSSSSQRILFLGTSSATCRGALVLPGSLLQKHDSTLGGIRFATYVHVFCPTAGSNRNSTHQEQDHVDVVWKRRLLVLRRRGLVKDKNLAGKQFEAGMDLHASSAKDATFAIQVEHSSSSTFAIADYTSTVEVRSATNEVSSDDHGVDEIEKETPDHEVEQEDPVSSICLALVRRSLHAAIEQHCRKDAQKCGSPSRTMQDDHITVASSTQPNYSSTTETPTTPVTSRSTQNLMVSRLQHSNFEEVLHLKDGASPEKKAKCTTSPDSCAADSEEDASFEIAIFGDLRSPPLFHTTLSPDTKCAWDWQNKNALQLLESTFFRFGTGAEAREWQRLIADACHSHGATADTR